MSLFKLYKLEFNSPNIRAVLVTGWGWGETQMTYILNNLISAVDLEMQIKTRKQAWPCAEEAVYILGSVFPLGASRGGTEVSCLNDTFREIFCSSAKHNG